MKRLLLLLLSTFSFAVSAHEITLSGGGWSAMLDPDAEWQDDKLYLPDELPELSTLPVNAPTDGWEVLTSGGCEVSVPMTIDEYFLEGINTNTYKGVSWVWRTFDAPSGVEDKVILLHIAKARMRVEVYINHKLAAYDIVGETPFQFDVSEYVTPNSTNQIAIRLTNPGGRRGWYDSPNLRWGEYYYTSNGRNFSTLGDVTLLVRDRVYVDDIFVKNILPTNGRKVSVEVEVMNREDRRVDKDILFTVTSDNSGKRIASHKVKKSLESGVNRFSFEMTLNRAELWTPDTPNLYNMSAQINDDIKTVRFGVRTFEVREGTSGGHNYYLNGERFIFRSAIDWGFYPFESDHKITAHGLYMSRPWTSLTPPIGYRYKELQPTLAVTLATIEYGEGKIVLNPCYCVDEENAFTDLLF
ncbi:MAG: hypothetical protein R3Y39_09025 [Rikenellaceae bacterium]